MHSLSDIKAERIRRDYGLFVRESWHVLERRPLSWNWHHEIMAHELQQCSDLARRGIRQDLVMNVPPGSLKSVMTSVDWWPWELLSTPISTLNISNDDSLAKRDSRKARMIMQSEWYQELWLRVHGFPLQFSADQNEVHHFALEAPFNNAFRQCVPFLGKIIGKRADRQILDDPQDVKEALGTGHHVAKRMEKAAEIDSQVLPSRLNDEDACPRVLIMQRIHPDDIAGGWIREGVRSVVIRQEYTPDDPLNHPEDPRTEPGQLLHPERTPERRVVYIKKKLGSKAYNAQHQQNPTNPAGGIFKKNKWVKVPRSQFPDSYNRVIQSWDLTFKGKQRNDFVVGYVIGVHGSMRYVLHRFKDRASFNEQLQAIRTVSALYPEARAKYVEDAANASALKDTLQDEIEGIILVKANDDKVARAQAWEPIQEAGNIVFPSDEGDMEWVEDAIQTHTDFPDGSNDDDVDALGHGILHSNDDRNALEDVNFDDDGLSKANEWDTPSYH